jgi:hypothetical protein
MKVMVAIADARRAAGEYRRALDIEYAVRTELATNHAPQRPRMSARDSTRSRESMAVQDGGTGSTLAAEQEELRRRSRSTTPHHHPRQCGAAEYRFQHRSTRSHALTPVATVHAVTTATKGRRTHVRPQIGGALPTLPCRV